MGKIAVWGLAPIEPLSGVYCNIKTRAFREEEEEEEEKEEEEEEDESFIS